MDYPYEEFAVAEESKHSVLGQHADTLYVISETLDNKSAIRFIDECSFLGVDRKTLVVVRRVKFCANRTTGWKKV